MGLWAEGCQRGALGAPLVVFRLVEVCRGVFWCLVPQKCSLPRLGVILGPHHSSSGRCRPVEQCFAVTGHQLTRTLSSRHCTGFVTPLSPGYLARLKLVYAINGLGSKI